MSEEANLIMQLLRQDPRYKIEAYQFVREGLSFGQSSMGLGDVRPSEGESEELDESDELDESEELGESGEEDEGDEGDEGDEYELRVASTPENWEPPAEKHLTGQELCESIRHYAVEQYGLMAKVVLNSWGIHSTSDLGELVYNLIRIGLMKKSNTDRREDFDNVYDFDEAFTRQFQITLPD